MKAEDVMHKEYIETMKRQAVKDKLIHDFIHDAMKSQGGRMFFASIIESTKMLKPASSLESNIQSYENGQKSVGFALVDMLNKADKQYFSKLLQGD